MKENKYFQWYIATTLIGSEESLFTSLMDKIKAYDFEDHVDDMRIITYKDIKIQYFDKNNPPPKSMKNSKFIKWEALDDGRYKKTTTKVINKFPGYIFIKMIMTDKVWYIIRNTPGITGFIGSSGKGAKPIPISEYEIEDLFASNNQDTITYINGDENSEKNTSIIHDKKNEQDDFFDSKKDSANNDDQIEVEHEINNNEQQVEVPSIDMDFKVGHTVEILNGVFAGEKAQIISIDNINKKVNVEMDILGRVTDITLNFDEIKKID